MCTSAHPALGASSLPECGLRWALGTVIEVCVCPKATQLCPAQAKDSLWTTPCEKPMAGFHLHSRVLFPECPPPPSPKNPTQERKKSNLQDLALFTYPQDRNLNARAWSRGKHLGANVLGEVPGWAPGNAIILTPHQHGGGHLAVDLVGTEGVDEEHHSCMHIVDHGPQVQPVRSLSVVYNEGCRGPCATWGKKRAE